MVIINGEREFTKNNAAFAFYFTQVLFFLKEMAVNFFNFDQLVRPED